MRRPCGDIYRETLFDIHYMSGRYKQAIECLLGWISPPCHIFAELAAANARLGQMEESRQAVTQLNDRQCKDFDLNQFLQAHFRMCAREEDRESWREGYRMVGFEV